MAWWKKPVVLGVSIWLAVLVSLTGLEVSPQKQIQQPDATKSAEHDIKPRTAEDRIANYTLWLERLTGLLAVSTIGLWYVTWKTLDHSRKDAERQTRQTRVSNIAAIRAADAADKTVTKMAETAERQLRAYLGIKVIKHGTFGSDDSGYWLQTPPIVHIELKNYGQTPAYKVKYWVRMGLAAHPAIGEFEGAGTLASDGRPMQPTATFTVAVGEGMALSEDQRQQIYSDTFAMRLYVWGEAVYDDAFGKERVTKFRLMYGGSSISSVGKFHWAEHGNEAT